MNTLMPAHRPPEPLAGEVWTSLGHKPPYDGGWYFMGSHTREFWPFTLFRWKKRPQQ